jgi:site-specific DNA-cytosine methylase
VQAVSLARLPRECDRIENIGYGGRQVPVVPAGADHHHRRVQRLLRRAEEHLRQIQEDDGSLRRPTVEDALALSGFPPDYRFPESASDAVRWRMIGNAVPPPMAEA